MAKEMFKKIAITDFEMTGLDPCRHEIIEFGVIIADANTLEIVATMDKKVKPEHLETANAESLTFAGYKEEEWREAISLKSALEEYSWLTQEAIFAAWPSYADWTFLVEAYRKTALKNPLDYHIIDVWTLAYEKLKDKPELGSLKLSTVCDYFGIPREPMPHRAINGAQKVYEVYKKLREL